RGSISLIRQRPRDTSTSGGRSDTERKALAVIPWIVSRWVVVTTVTPVAKRPMTLRSSRAAASACDERGVSRAMPVGAPSDAGGGGASGGLPRPALGGVPVDPPGRPAARRIGGIMPVEAVGG